MTYTVIIYSEDNKAIEVFKDAEEPAVSGQDIRWANYEIIGIQAPFIVIEGTHEIEQGADVSPYLGQDVKAQLLTKDKQQENEIAQLQAMVNELIFGGMGV